MSSFDNSAKRIQFHARSLDDQIYPSTLGMVSELKDRFRANVILNSGEIHEDVRYYGPAILEKGDRAHGRAQGLQVNQLVLIEFIRGSFRSPIISKAYPFYAQEDDLENIRDFWDKYRSFIDPETDIVDFHKSGYFVRQTTDKIEFYDSENEMIGSIDFSEKKLSWKLENIDIESKVKIKGDIEIEGDIKSKGKLELEGDLSVDGEVSATNDIKSDSDIKAGNISLTNHTHQYSPGPSPSAPTGPPQ
jgi:hypothetical protein